MFQRLHKNRMKIRELLGTPSWIMISGIAVCLKDWRAGCGCGLGFELCGQSQNGVGRSGSTVFGWKKIKTIYVNIGLYSPGLLGATLV